MAPLAPLRYAPVTHQHCDLPQMTRFTNRTSTFRCPGAAPGKVIDLKFSENMPSLVLGKVRKFQPRSSSRFGDIPEKPEGWMKTTPPLATNRVKTFFKNRKFRR